MSRRTPREIVLLMAREIQPENAPEDDDYIGDWVPEHEHLYHDAGPDCAACWIHDYDIASAHRNAPPPAAVKHERYPPAPAGFVACRTILCSTTLTHLVALDEHGSNGGRPTVCGLTRFDDRDADGNVIPNTAGLPGWGMGDSGVTGPGVKQIKCADCYTRAVHEPEGSES